MGGWEGEGGRQRQVAAVFTEGTGTASGISYKGKWEGARTDLSTNMQKGKSTSAAYLRAVWTPDGRDGVMGGIVSNTNNTVPGQDKMGTSHLIYYLLSSLIYYLYLMSYQYLLLYHLPRSKSGQLETGITACKGIRHF